MVKGLHTVKNRPVKKITVYRINHSSFMTEAIYGSSDVVNYASYTYGRRMNLEEALSTLEKDNYEIMPCIVGCLI